MYEKPEWWDEWVIKEPNNFHLKKGAPKEIVEEFKELRKDKEKGIYV